MILDLLANAHRYLALHKGFARAFDFLGRPDLQELPMDSYEIDEKRIYAMVAREPGCKKGIDTMGWRPRSLCQQPTEEYDPETDLQFFNDEPEIWLPTHPGFFAIFFPEDAHMPLISSGLIHKVVVKIAVTEW